MIVNLAKFHEVIFDKLKGNHTNQIKNIKPKKKIEAVSKVNFLQIETDDKLNFHMKNICTPT